jgi:hypothetical protein
MSPLRRSVQASACCGQRSCPRSTSRPSSPGYRCSQFPGSAGRRNSRRHCAPPGRGFGDDHAYTAADVAALIAEAKAKACHIAVTEKDMVKLAPLWPAAERSLLLSVPVTLAFDDEEALDALLRGCLAKARSAAAGAAHAQ